MESRYVVVLDLHPGAWLTIPEEGIEVVSIVYTVLDYLKYVLQTMWRLCLCRDLLDRNRECWVQEHHFDPIVDSVYW